MKYKNMLVYVDFQLAIMLMLIIVLKAVCLIDSLMRRMAAMKL